ncbi:hypothetical protein HN873_008723 [Arachis hypogaea]
MNVVTWTPEKSGGYSILVKFVLHVFYEDQIKLEDVDRLEFMKLLWSNIVSPRVERTQHNTHTHHLTHAEEESSRKETPPCCQLCRAQPAAAVESNPRERERECDDERGGAVTKCVAAAGGASRFAVAEEGKEELLLSRQSLSCFLVADEGAARTVAVAEEGDTREGAVTVVAIVAVEYMFMLFQ